MRGAGALLLGLFVAVLSSTVVATALPRIVSDLGGGQPAYTWIVVATLLAVTVSTPIWGKFADLFDPVVLFHAGLGLYAAGSLLAALSGSTGELIACRALQGLGVGGITALVQVILADLVGLRELGRYGGYLAGVFALGTVSGPLLGGGLTETLGWRWCFLAMLPPTAAVALMARRTLRLPRRRRRRVRIDFGGAMLFSAAALVLLGWLSLAGQRFAWGGWQTELLVPVGLALLAAAIAAERRVAEPLIPLRLFRQPTVVLAAAATVVLGAALFAVSVFGSQYMQVARGYSPAAAALLSLPMVVALAGAATGAGRDVARSGRYRRCLLLGALLQTAGAALMATVGAGTSLVFVAGALSLMGAGVGLLMQNLLLVAQNAVPPADLGAGTSLIAFARGVGGAAGLSGLGTLLAARARHEIGAAQLGSSGLHEHARALPNPRALHGAARHAVEHAYASGVAAAFLHLAPLCALALLALMRVPETPLRGRVTRERS
jgi:MFS family permease